MPRSNKRASQAKLDSLHRLVATELESQLRHARKAKQPVSAALLSQVIAFLKAAETTAPDTPKRKDALRRAMPDFDELEGLLPPYRRTDAPASAGTPPALLDFDPPGRP